MKQADDQHKDLSRIKEILFGEELQGLDARLEELRDELVGIIENQIKSLEEKLKEQKVFHEKQMEAVTQLLEEEKQDKKALEKVWQETRRKMKVSMDAYATQYDEKLKAFSKQQHAQNTKILEALKTEILDGMKKLDETKVNKVEIAELFGLMIQKLK
jgi:DNA anti-recombination protein RmuC